MQSITHLLAFEAMYEDALQQMYRQTVVLVDGCWSKSYRVEENRTKNWTFETAANSREQVPRKVLENARGKEISL